MPDDINPKGEGGTSNKSGSLACALSVGVPIVGTAGDLNNRLLLDGQNILLTDIMDAPILSEALRGALNPEIGRTMGIEARKLYDTHLTWTVLADKFLDIMTPSVKKEHFEILTAPELTPF